MDHYQIQKCIYNFYNYKSDIIFIGKYGYLSQQRITNDNLIV